jgi:hypothetical protein
MLNDGITNGDPGAAATTRLRTSLSGNPDDKCGDGGAQAPVCPQLGLFGALFAHPDDRWGPADRGLAFFQSIAPVKSRNLKLRQTSASSNQKPDKQHLMNGARPQHGRSFGYKLPLTPGKPGLALPSFSQTFPNILSCAVRRGVQSGEGVHVRADPASCWLDHGRCCALHVGCTRRCAQQCTRGR